MEHLNPEDLYTLEAYAKLRPEFRARVMEHKKHRRLQLGEHVALLVEDRLTMQYQVQEMLRAERIFEAPEIRDELPKKDWVMGVIAKGEAVAFPVKSLEKEGEAVVQSRSGSIRVKYDSVSRLAIAIGPDSSAFF